MGQEASEEALTLAEQLRAEKLWVEINYDPSSLKSQMRKANRMNAKNVIVLGEEELKKGIVLLKNMQDRKEIEIAIDSEGILKATRREK
jgi:histidyl-tRNA synthetase